MVYGTAWTKFGGGSGGSVVLPTIDFYNRTFTSIINQSDLLAIDNIVDGWWQAQKICVYFKN
jgi:hypothetical protein